MLLEHRVLSCVRPCLADVNCQCSAVQDSGEHIYPWILSSGLRWLACPLRKLAANRSHKFQTRSELLKLRFGPHWFCLNPPVLVRICEIARVGEDPRASRMSAPIASQVGVPHVEVFLSSIKSGTDDSERLTWLPVQLSLRGLLKGKVFLECFLECSLQAMTTSGCARLFLVRTCSPVSRKPIDQGPNFSNFGWGSPKRTSEWCEPWSKWNSSTRRVRGCKAPVWSGRPWPCVGIAERWKTMCHRRSGRTMGVTLCRLMPCSFRSPRENGPRSTTCSSLGQVPTSSAGTHVHPNFFLGTWW